MDFWKEKFKYIFVQHKHKKTWRAIATFMAAVVVFVTTYGMILPAITMETEIADEMPGIQLEHNAEPEQTVEDDLSDGLTGGSEIPESSVEPQDSEGIAGQDITTADDDKDETPGAALLTARTEKSEAVISNVSGEMFPAGMSLTINELKKEGFEYNAYRPIVQNKASSDEEEPGDWSDCDTRIFDLRFIDKDGYEVILPHEMKAEIKFTEPMTADLCKVVLLTDERDDLTGDPTVINADSVRSRNNHTLEMMRDGNNAVIGFRFRAEAISLVALLTKQAEAEPDVETNDEPEEEGVTEQGVETEAEEEIIAEPETDPAEETTTESETDAESTEDAEATENTESNPETDEAQKDENSQDVTTDDETADEQEKETDVEEAVNPDDEIEPEEAEGTTEESEDQKDNEVTKTEGTEEETIEVQKDNEVTKTEGTEEETIEVQEKEEAEESVDNADEQKEETEDTVEEQKAEESEDSVDEEETTETEEAADEEEAEESEEAADEEEAKESEEAVDEQEVEETEDTADKEEEEESEDTADKEEEEESEDTTEEREAEESEDTADEEEEEDSENTTEGQDSEDNDPVEETEEADETEQSEEELSLTYPAQEFLEDTEFVHVYVKAGVGAFPADTTMKVEDVDDDETIAAIEEAVEQNVSKVHAVNISFYAPEDPETEIQPLIPVQVVIKAEESAESEEIKVVHVDDDGVAKEVGTVNLAELDEKDGEAQATIIEPGTDVEADDTTDIETESANAAEGQEAESVEESTTEPEQEESETIETSDDDAVVNTTMRGRRNVRLSAANRGPALNVETDDSPTESETTFDELISGNEEGTELVSFYAGGFSIYALVYTVDFHYEVNGKMYQFSLPGGGFVSFTELVEVLGITRDTNFDENAANDVAKNIVEVEEKDIEDAPLTLDDVEISEATRKFIANVENVEFSSPELVWVGKAESDITVGGLKEANGLECKYSAELTEAQIIEINEQMVEAGDWALISMTPFTSEEKLIVTMKNGEQFTVKVKDGQLHTYVISNKGDTYEIIVTYDDTAEIPTDAELMVREIKADSEEYAENITTVNEEIDTDNEPAFSNPVQFDISIMSGDVKVEPKEGSIVNVEIKLTKSLLKAEKSDKDEFGDTDEVPPEEGKDSENNGGMILFQDKEIAAGDGDGEITDCKLAHILDDGSVDIINEIEISQTDDQTIVEFETDSFSDYMVQNNSQYNNGDINKLPNEIYVGDVIYLQGSPDIWVTAIGSVVTETKHKDNSSYKTVQAINEGYFRICHKNNWDNGSTGTPWNNAGGKVIHVLPKREGTNPPGTIETVNNTSVGIKLNLFDYDLDDYLNDRFNNYDYAGSNAVSYENDILSAFLNYGINNGHALKFWGSGITNGRHGDLNNYVEHGVTSIVESQLVGGYPKLSGYNETLQYLFDPTANTSDREVYQNANGLFKKEGDYYVYDSNVNYAYYDPTQGSNGSFVVYNSTYEQKSRGAGGEQASSTNGKAIGFFPFHKWDRDYDLYVNWNKKLNHHFGMSMSVDFSLPKEPKAVKDTDGKDIVFDFSGDDDMWVFIDGKLAMDIGGIHQPTNGTINFATQKVIVNGNEQSFDFNGLYDGEKHTLQVFYLERGGCDSNCKIKFNMTQYGDVECDKVDHDDETKLLPGAIFGLYKDEVCTIPLLENLKTGGSRAFIAESDENGQVKFEDVPLGTYYLKEIGAPEGYPIDQSVHPVTVYVNESGTASVKVTIDGKPTEEGIKITNKLPEPINLGLKKIWQNTDDENITAPDGAKATFKLKRIRTYETYEEKPAPEHGESVSKLTVGWIQNGQIHIYKEYNLISNTRATVSWRYVNGYNGDIACVENGTTITKSSNPNNIYSEEITMPGAGQEATLYIVDTSETGEAIANINVAGDEFIGNGGGGIIHHFETFSEMDSTFVYTGDTNVMNNQITLPINNSWEYNFSNLPLVRSDDDHVYTYSYFLEEVSTENPSQTMVIYIDTDGNVINSPMDAETSASGTQTIINQIPSGYLRIDKFVTYNGVAPSTDQQKSALAGIYRFKVYADENCSRPYKVIQGTQETDLVLTVDIAADGTSKSSDTVKLPVGNYWIEEQTPSQTGVTPEENRIRVLIEENQTTEEPAIASFTNNKEESDNPDELTIELEKTFTGLPNATKIPSDFQAVLTYKLPNNDNQVTVNLTGSTVGHVTCIKSDDGMTWHWRVTHIPKDATDFGVYESGYDITGYTRITKINGVEVANPSKPQAVTVLIPEIIMTNISRDYTTSDKYKVFTVVDNQILLVRMTSQATVIVSPKSLSLATRKAIENTITRNSNKIPGDDGANAEWVPTFIYFSHEIQGDSFSYGGRTIYFEENQVKIPHNASSHEARVDISYTSTSAENSFTLENDYTEIPTEVDVFKVEKGKETTTQLAGAVFELRKLEDVVPTEGGTLTYVKDDNQQEIVTIETTGDNGRLTFSSLTYGVYEIREVSPPPGYIKAEEIIWYLKVDGREVTYLQKGTNKPSEWTSASNNNATVFFTEAQAAVTDNPETPENESIEAVNATFMVGNTPGVALPNTGGPGTRLLYLLGCLLTLSAGFALFYRRRKNMVA